MNSRFTDALLGVLFFGALIGLGWVTIGVSDFAFLAQRYDVEIFSPDVGYLRPGDPILLHGMTAGKVMEITRMEDPVNHVLPDGRNVPLTIRIQTKMDLDPYEILGADHHIYIEDRGLLGGRLLRIESGSSQPLHPRGKTLVALSSQSLWQTGTEVVAENRDSIKSILSDLAAFTARVRNGEGLLGAMLYDEVLREQWTTVSSNLRASTDRIERGEGLIGRLLRDERLAVDAESVVANAVEISADLRAVSERLEAGEGTLGRLLAADDTIYPRIDAILGDIERFTRRLDAGEGVLGALVSDDELADDLRSILAQLRGLIEDARETAPVQDVGSFLFGTF